MIHLFQPLTLRGVTFRNRAWVSPMCQYSATDGLPGDWHLVHLGALAVGGAGLVMTEASAISPHGRISPADTGLWSDGQAEAWARVVRFLKAQGASTGVQLAHAGRKASTAPPWQGGRYVSPAGGGWEPVGPSPIAFGALPPPRELTEPELRAVVADFRAAAARALQAGFDVVELHAAHGYLLHSFLSPLSNHRTDGYGGGFDGRTRLLLETVRAIREVWPEDRPLFVRVSATDWVEGGWDLPSTVELARRLKPLGVDLLDCSSGALVADAKVPVSPGYQVPFARAVKQEAGLPTAAVGLLTEPSQVEEVLARQDADAVFLARELLRDPHWPLRAAQALGVRVPWPVQYERARPS